MKVDDLLTKLKNNRAKHKSIVDKALAEYRRQAINELEGSLADLRLGKKQRRLTIYYSRPMDQTAEYDQAIAMMEATVDKIIELDQNQFACYVLDEWSWKKEWATSNSTYTRID
jgi:hypothetical protein